MGNYLQKRGGVWVFKRRVPQQFQDVDPREFVKQSTGVRVSSDRNGLFASRVAERINQELEAYWAGLKAGRKNEAEKRYEAACKQARALGFVYMPAAELAMQPVQEILARLGKLTDMGGKANGAAVAALLGGEEKPPIMLSTLFKTYRELVAADIKDFSPDQLRKWANSKQRSIANLMAVTGDMDITQLTRAHAIEFRARLQDRVLKLGLTAGSANKDIGNLNNMLRTVELRLQLGLQPIFSQLRLGGDKDGQRDAFEPSWIQTKILAEGALADLNIEARCIVYIMVETGMRPSEIANLTKDTIRLDGHIPYVMVRPDGRRMKTDESAREIPLVGVALMAAQALPGGFPRYRDKTATLSATVNKFFNKRGLLPSDNHSLYSLRHSFEDRLTEVEAPDKLIATLMGHKFSRPRYGKGPTLEQKLKWLKSIAFTPPKSI